ncbi:MAG: hypothetical protein GVY17_03320, partial [Cyanobacteria bacterium]|nr:hypothetical protein [Cyanobacteria bacterium GSL.Bin21]
MEQLNSENDIRHTLRSAQQTSDVAQMQQTLDHHPELEFTDDADLLAILAAVYGLLQQTGAAQRCLNDLDPNT